MKPEFLPAIEALKKDLAEQELKVSETKTMINKLHVLAGGSPIYNDINEHSQAGIASIQGDTFYGKVVVTAAREYLEMRKAANLGPASVREVYEALKKGGFIFNSKNDTNSMTVLRTAMSKASAIFHRLPTGDYGLAKWYDMSKVKRSKTSVDDDSDQSQIEDDDVQDSDEIISADSVKESADE